MARKAAGKNANLSQDPVTERFRHDLGFAFGDIHRLLRHHFQLRVAETGLSRPQWQMIGFLIRHEGMTQIELAREMELGRSAVGKTVDQLEHAGFVERRPCSEDARVWRLFLAPPARAVIPKILKQAKQLSEEALAPLSEKERATLRHLLERLRDRLVSLG